MTTYSFDVVLASLDSITDELADALFAAGSADCTPTSCDGKAWLHFDREAVSFAEAIDSAVAQIKATGARIASIECC